LIDLKCLKPATALLMGCLALSAELPAFAQDADKVLAEVVEKQKKQLPLILDAESTVDNIVYADKKLEYTITLPGYKGQPGEQGYYESFLNQQIMRTLCKQTAYLMVLALGNQISYRYIDNDGAPITQITLSEKSCPAQG